MGDLKKILADHTRWLLGIGGARASLRGIDLHGSDLRGVGLREADLRRADLRCADLRGADLRGADLRCADLRGANLGFADLRGADLEGAILNGANLRGADLRGALLPDGYSIAPVGRWTAIIRVPENRLDIGCQCHTFTYWQEHLTAIAVDNEATEDAISAVGRILEECNV